MRTIALALAILFSVSSHANQAAEKTCEQLIADLAGISPEGKELERIRKTKNDLEQALADDVRAQYRLLGVSQMRAVQIYERVLFLLARGDTRELVPLLRPYFSNVYDNFKILRAVGKQITALKAEHPVKRTELAELEKRFVQASKPFGEYYGGFDAFSGLLQSVVDGKGVDDAADIASDGDDTGKNIHMNLTSQPAKAAAKRALNVLKPSADPQWLPHLAKEDAEPSLDEIRAMFKHNIHAVIAKLQKDQKDQQYTHNVWRKGVHYLANFYLTLTDRSFIPERYRKWLVRLTGIAYDQMMIERYLDKVQAIVDVARNRSSTGNIILSDDDETLQLQTRLLMELRATGVGEDLLTTFARLGYHTDSWVNLKKYVDKKAEESKTATQAYVELAASMRDAEQRKAELGTLPFTYDPAARHQLIFVSIQLAWLAGTEEWVRHFGIPWSHQIANYLF